MPNKGQEGSQTHEPSKDDLELIEKFKRIGTEAILRQFEVNNRDKLADPSPFVYIAFNQKWKDLTDKPYYQAITTVETVMAPWDGRNDTRVSDPKAMNYREPIVFSKIFWQKVRQKIGKKFRDWYIIDGITKETGEKRVIFGRLSVERVYEIFGGEMIDSVDDDGKKSKIDAATKIITDSKKEQRGYLDLDIEIQTEAFWEVQFAPQKDQNDTPDVRLKVDGRCLRALRMTRVIMPGFFLENADNTTRDVYTHEPGRGRQRIGKVQKYPYTVHRKATLQEFLDFKERGDKQQREFERQEEERGYAVVNPPGLTV